MVWNAVIFGPGESFENVSDHATTFAAATTSPALVFLLPHADPSVADTPFEDGTFKLVLTFEESYPNKPPHVKFLSRMFHPNVYNTGELCLDILQNRWSPTYDVAAILTSIQSLLHDPNPNRSVTLSETSRLPLIQLLLSAQQMQRRLASTETI
jgi:hypothetical protein